MGCFSRINLILQSHSWCLGRASSTVSFQNKVLYSVYSLGSFTGIAISVDATRLYSTITFPFQKSSFIFLRVSATTKRDSYFRINKTLFTMLFLNNIFYKSYPINGLAFLSYKIPRVISSTPPSTRLNKYFLYLRPILRFSGLV